MKQPESQPLQDEAKAYMERHAWTDAIALLQRDIVEHPSDPWSRLFLGGCYFRLFEFDAALEHFEAAAALAPGYSAPIRSQADAHCAAAAWERGGELYYMSDRMKSEEELAHKNWHWWRSKIAWT